MRNKNSKITDTKEFVTSPGNKVHVTYSPKVLDNGIIKLIPSGKENIQDKINSFRDTCDMSFILSRLAMGDTSVINKNSMTFGDFTKVPKSYAEALQLVIDAEKQFYELPLETRNLFDNDYKQWFASAGSDSWLDRMGINKEQKVVEASEKEVKDGVAE